MSQSRSLRVCSFDSEYLTGYCVCVFKMPDNFAIFYIFKCITEKINNLYMQVFYNLTYYYGALHNRSAYYLMNSWSEFGLTNALSCFFFYRLTMSSSSQVSQVSSSDTQLSTSYKFKPLAYHTNELQEVTSCTKEIVRITPPLRDGVPLRPTVLTCENNTPNGYVYWLLRLMPLE